MKNKATKNKTAWSKAVDLFRKGMMTGNQGFKRTPMTNAYCSYMDCADTTIYPYVIGGDNCPKCGKPLSWSGPDREPLGKVTPGK